MSPDGNGGASASADQSAGDSNADGGDINIDPNVDLDKDGGDAPEQ